MTPSSGAACLSALTPDTAGALVGRMPPDTVAIFLRRMSPAQVDGLLAALPRPQAAALRAGLAFPARSVGALMDPRASTLTPELTAQQAIKRLQGLAQVDDEVYVVGRDQRLVGVLPMRVLVVSEATARVDTIMQHATSYFSPGAVVDVVHVHPAWTHSRSLPVVAEDRRFLGVIGYDVVVRAVRDGEGSRLVEASVGTLASFSELCYVGSTRMLASMVSILTERVEQLDVEAR
jgi:Mg/Co/Ni transporter MgtE